MPSMPGLLATLTEKSFGHRANVAAIEQVSPNFRRMELRVEPLKSGWKAGQDVQFRIDDNTFRHYSVMSVDDSGTTISVLFHLGVDGPGSRWAAARATGDEMIVLGMNTPEPKRPAAEHLYLGDGSAVGTVHGLAAKQNVGGTASGAVEVPAEDLEALTPLLPGIDVLPAAPIPGDAIATWLEASTPCCAAASLFGHAQSIQRQRRILLDHNTLPRKAIATKPYWATGKVGL
ncbi:siderophore-interacting protein [Nocardia macrotermitis]|uniref:FAD-binding FR-type domain-containing protein n=1 Tax=Nocardia macrotermitis TaxID=2585198 RepID=A0A7K0DBF3_9NOCA|nr:siderophore-interacting protein [Nocardia macrotermitis]MQY23115.1 hypothetical protein [Nocardia macrotermitis]